MRRLILALAVLVLVLAGCSATGGASGFNLAEFSITGPTSLDAGEITVDVTNSGEFPHTLVVTDHSGQVVANTSLLQPGETVGLQLEAEPGRYQFTCRIVTEIDGGEIIDHFERGMNATVDIG